MFFMLVPAMNNKEITAEIKRDAEKIYAGTFNRLIEEYDKERRKFKIDKTKTYCKEYKIKTAAKNNWVLFFRKKDNVDIYKGLADAGGCCITYYYNEQGLRFFSYTGNGHPIEVYNAHFFKRYSERLQLNITDTLEVAKYFTKTHNEVRAGIMGEDDDEYLVALYEEGIGLGRYDAEYNWIIYNTFISNELVRDDQQEMSKTLLSQIEVQRLRAKIKSIKLPSVNYLVKQA